MANYNYAFQSYNDERMARAVGRDLSVSAKQAIEICNALRRKNLQKAKTFLEEVKQMKTPVRFTRFTNGIGHRKGGGAGAYPVKVATAFLELLNSVEINAQNKGLNTGQLALIHICAQRASSPMHQGRKRRSEFKRSHVEVVVAEVEMKKGTKVEKTKVVKKEEKIEKKAETKEKAEKTVKADAPVEKAKIEKKVETKENKVEKAEKTVKTEAPVEKETTVKVETKTPKKKEEEKQ